MKKILFIFGTRPEAIKLAPLILEFKKRSEYEVLVCTTAQHRQMLDQILAVSSITPDMDLDLMQHNQGLAQISASTLTSINEVLVENKPDLVILQGDTTTVLSAALACFYNKIAIAHVEAGLRTFNKFPPFPEEVNRVLTTTLATWHLAPTDLAKSNLLNENISERSILVTGNTVIDAIIIAKQKLRNEENLTFINKEVLDVINTGRRYVLITSHRRENFGEAIRSICNAIAKLAISFPEIDFIYPVHLNPNIRQPVFDILSGSLNNVKLLDPLDYPSFVILMDNSYIVLSDSGGIQEEAPALGKPLLILRDTTERPEAVQSGVAKLVGTDEVEIYNQTAKLLNNSDSYKSMALNISPFGDGFASSRIYEFIKERL